MKWSILTLSLLGTAGSVHAFTPSTAATRLARPSTNSNTIPLAAGGFEWDDPMGDAYDQGVENPFKNPDLMKKKEDGQDMLIDPARLLGPRLNGANLYFIGMMGSGKTAVAEIIAKRKWQHFIRIAESRTNEL